jgi:hypothetical protein
MLSGEDMGHALPRPPFYARALNAAGARLERRGWLARLAFDAEALMRAARARTRLDDFGSAPLSEPLERLARATESESRLTLTGRIAIRSHLVDLLVNRLQLQRDRARDPRIATQAIEHPVFIFGLPRTGTTLLHNLISQDDGVRVPLTWEVMYPSPPPRSADAADGRVARTERALRWLDRLAPDFKRIHPVGALLPQECIAIAAHSFASIQFHTTQRVPSYEDWLEGRRMDDAYRCHREFLQQLQRHGSARRWVLKAPGHLFALDALLAVYPDACLVQTHRDPLRVVGSIASHGVVLRAAFSDAVDPREVARDWSARWAHALASALRVRDAPATSPRFLDLHYEQIVRDPVAAVRAIYAHAEMELGTEAERRMRAFLAANPQDRHGPHRYTLEQYGLDRDEEAGRYAGYCTRFGIEREPARTLPA